VIKKRTERERDGKKSSCRGLKGRHAVDRRLRGRRKGLANKPKVERTPEKGISKGLCGKERFDRGLT
jgi:hypothetical protein